MRQDAADRRTGQTRPDRVAANPGRGVPARVGRAVPTVSEARLVRASPVGEEVAGGEADTLRILGNDEGRRPIVEDRVFAREPGPHGLFGFGFEQGAADV